MTEQLQTKLINYFERKPRQMLDSLEKAGYDKLFSFRGMLSQEGIKVDLQELSDFLNSEYKLRTSTGMRVVAKPDTRHDDQGLLIQIWRDSGRGDISNLVK